MKYIHSYKLFESIINIDEIQEILLPISDKGFKVEVRETSGIFYDVNDNYQIYITKPTNPHSARVSVDFNYSDIKEDLEFSINYIVKYLPLSIHKIEVGQDKVLRNGFSILDEISNLNEVPNMINRILIKLKHEIH